MATGNGLIMVRHLPVCCLRLCVQRCSGETIKGSFGNHTQPTVCVTQLHAAAVNGEKQTLIRLLTESEPSDLDVGDQFGRTPLMFCVLADRLECAELLLKARSHINIRDKGGRTALHWAAHKGNYRLMKLLLSRGADYREKDNEGQTALHLITRHKLPKCMGILLRQLLPGEIDDQDNSKRTALHWASFYGNLEHVKMLIKQDSNIGIPDIEGKTPLHCAASCCDPEAVQCVKLILETTPSVINWQDYEGRTALHLAVADGNQSIVDLLTSVEKCTVSALDNMFRTPLHWAAFLGHSRIVKLLLQNSADCTSSDSNGATPLHYAAQNNFDETVDVFLSWKNMDEPDLEGRTAFMWAAGKGAANVLQVFFKHGVDVQQEDKTGGTALHAAGLAGYAETVQLLLKHGASINATDQAKHTPLLRACEMGHTDVVQTLIDRGACVDILDQDGRSPLHWAALGGHAYICQILIKYGVDPNINDHSGHSPLQCAAYGGYVNCMSALIEHHADPNMKDKEGMTCLHWACSRGHLDAVKLLIEHNAFPNHMEFTEDRYTPLDYALMGEYHDVAQYMIEQGALSITGIQDIAATKIQSAFRGYCMRKTFFERKKLLMKHEMLKKEAARKRAEEGKKSDDHRRDAEDNGDSFIERQPSVACEHPPFLENPEIYK
ncbi:inversin-like isoform X3 [Pomacea canaliculata]|uniref:inversin-like isoform X3 n=1 Tax=Pomacea canaliculata TaxID=400727 RepID=UPI000D730F5A|nr:inversin-like isoform X3 [Pomacea canaliculata]